MIISNTVTATAKRHQQDNTMALSRLSVRHGLQRITFSPELVDEKLRDWRQTRCKKLPKLPQYALSRRKTCCNRLMNIKHHGGARPRTRDAFVSLCASCLRPFTGHLSPSFCLQICQEPKRRQCCRCPNVHQVHMVSNVGNRLHQTRVLTSLFPLLVLWVSWESVPLKKRGKCMLIIVHGEIKYLLKSRVK